MKNEDQTKAQPGLGSLQREAGREEGKHRETIKAGFRKNIRQIREGHLTGGYCDSEALKGEEKKLYAVLATELEEAKAKFGYSPDPKFKHPTIRAIELELNGLSWKPRLVVAE